MQGSDAIATAAPRRRGRPPLPHEAAATHQRLIRAGLIFLTEQGYSATALDDILRAAEVTKGSFYHYFDGKAAFAHALIDAYHAHFAARLDRHLGDAALPPLARLQGFTRDAESRMARHDFRRGCLIGNLGQEVTTLPDPFRARLISVLTAWQDRTAQCLSAAQETGDIAPDRDPVALAEFFWTGWEGAVLRARLDRSALPLQAFSRQFFLLITP